MSAFLSLQLDVWREACRHIRIEESAANILPLLRSALGVETLCIRRLDPARSRLETVALAGQASDQDSHVTELDLKDWAELLECCRSGSLVSGQVEVLERRYPGLLPPAMKGAILAGGLNHEDKPFGAVILQTSKRFSREQADTMARLIEPFAVALENDRRLRELSSLREAAEADRKSLLTRLKRQDISDTVVGEESGLKAVMERVERVARSDAPVLILGETGTGKEVVARAVHCRSRRAAGPFLRVNCGAVPAELIDSELFGHERGSFTGAVTARKGWFERADGGSLFLDEVGELSPAAQVRLLRILQDGTFQRVGGQQTLGVDVRVIAATNRDLRAMVAERAFREDLWYRIAVFPIALPALRERPEDIPALAIHFALRAAERLGLAPQTPNRDDLALLAAYPWPGNVRELASVMERAAILGDGRRLEMAAALGVVQPLPPRVPISEPPAGGAPLGLSTFDDMARQHIAAVLTRTGGRVQGPFGAARILGVNPNTLRTRMRKLGVEPKRFRPR